LCHGVPCPHYTDGANQGEHEIGDQDQSIAKLNDGVVTGALSQQGPHTTDNHVAQKKASANQVDDFQISPHRGLSERWTQADFSCCFPWHGVSRRTATKKTKCLHQANQNFEDFQQNEDLANGSFPLFQFAEQIHHPLHTLIKTPGRHGPEFCGF